MTTRSNVFYFLGPVIAIQAFAEVYLSEEQALKVIFPGPTFAKNTSAAEAKDYKIWKATTGEVIFIDQVLGKHEMITYAVGIDTAGKVKGVEILEYRESYGHQIKKPEWRAQFVGKDKNSTLQLDQDIKNIGGATLSASHITNGVKKILQTYDRIHGSL